MTNTHNYPTQNGFVFFDVETSGLSKHFDQILQFSAIRTDANYNIINPDYDILDLNCRRLPWIVPSPEAMLVTRSTPEDLDYAPLSHYEMMSKVHLVLTDWAPAIFLGYNSLSFDEEMLRNNLFATLHQPYLTSQRGCGRADVLNILKTITVLAPGAIKLPEINGKPSMRLGNVLRENGIDFEDAEAHDALVDVKGTIALLKLMKERCPAIVDHMLHMASRDSVRTFLSQNVIFQHVTYFGTPNIALATYVAANPENANEVAIFDLAQDPGPYLEMSIEDIMVALRAKPRTLRTIKLNAQPSILHRDKGGSSPTETSNEILEARAALLATAVSFQQKVAEAMRRLQQQYPTSLHVEQQLYNGFPGYEDKRQAGLFHFAADWRQRFQIAYAFTDPRLRYHAIRLIYTECPAALPAYMVDQVDHWMRDRLFSLDADLPYLTLHAACEDLEALQLQDPSDGGHKHAALDAIQRYYLMIASGHS